MFQRTNMYCHGCENNVKDCTCEDLEKRLDEAVQSGHFDYNKCLMCGKHYARCRCEKPQLMLASVYNALKKMGDS